MGHPVRSLHLILRPLVTLSVCFLIAACGAAGLSGPEGSTPAEATTTVEATAFLTENAPPPDGAADSKGDGILRDANNRPFSYALLGKKLPEFSATMADGAVFESAALNRWTVIDIWGAWCSDCLADGPYVAALERAIAQDPDLDFVSIHVPASKARATPAEMFGEYGSLEAYFEAAGYLVPTVLDTDGSLRETLTISWTPTYLLVSPDGVVRGFRTDLSVAGSEPVKDFLRDVARVKKTVGNAQGPMMGPAGVLGITGTTPFTLAAIEAAFPGHTVVSTTEGEGATAQPVFQVRTPGTETPRFIVEADWSRGFVSRVRTNDPTVEGPNGMRVGSTRYSDLRQEELAGCGSLGAGEDLSISCKTSVDAPYLLLYFRSDKTGAPPLAQMSFHPPVPSPSP